MTRLATFRIALAPSVVLATGGVVVTALLTGLAASAILGLPLLEGLLLGSIIGSTDSAAVFAILRSKGVNLEERIAATLEIESGSNDPMAVFLTVALIEVLLGNMRLGVDLIGFLLLQMGVGTAVGLSVGFAAVRLLNRMELGAAGLYPVLAASMGFLAFGLAAVLGGSGFLSVYLAGIVIGNRRVVFQRGILLFHGGAAWLAQISMFVLLGLLSFPSRLWEVGWQGLAIAAVLIFVARPAAVFLLMPAFRFSVREMTFLSWVGLRGAVPIILATYPLMHGLPSGELLFDVVFFVVLVSAVTQGWSLPVVARALGLQREAAPEPPVSLEITSLRHVDGDIVGYDVGSASRAAGRRIRELALPDGAVVALITRGERMVPPRGSTTIEAGDHVFVVLRSDVRPLVDLVFAREPDAAGVPQRLEFPLRGSTTVADLERFYGIRFDAPGSRTLDEILRERLGDRVAPGAFLVVEGVRLTVREIVDGRIDAVGLAIL